MTVRIVPSFPTPAMVQTSNTLEKPTNNVVVVGVSKLAAAVSAARNFLFMLLGAG